MQMEDRNRETDWDGLVEHLTVRSRRPDEAHSAEQSLSKLMRRIWADDEARLFRHRIARYRVWLAAAMVALLVSLGGLYAVWNAEPTLLVATNHSGVVKDLTLPDGTAIKLNNHSKLIYPETFSKGTREVFLEGEAYFDVAHDKKHPFIVRAGDLRIKVLGTKFTVDACSQKPQITATLIEGSIDVSDKDQHMLMKPSEQLAYDVESGHMQLAEIENAENMVRWTENVWVLSQTPLLDICHQLEHLFNVTFIIMNDELINKSFTGEFYTSDSLESILETIQITTPFKFEKRGNNIVIK